MKSATLVAEPDGARSLQRWERFQWLDHGLSLLVESCRELLISLYTTRKHFPTPGWPDEDRPRVGLPSQMPSSNSAASSSWSRAKAATPLPRYASP